MFWENRTPSEDRKTFLIDSTTSLSYGQVFDQADALFGNVSRDVILILCERKFESVIAYVGALRAGLVPLLIDEATRADPLARLLERYLPYYVFASQEVEVPELWHVCAELGEGRLWKRKSNSYVSPVHDDLCLLLTTSGSTGDPKTVRLTTQNIQSCTDEICRYLSMSAQVRALALLPLHYSYGLSVLHCCMNSRASIVLSQKSVLDRDFWAFINEMEITDLAGVPFIFDIMRRMKIPDAVMKKLRCVTQAGGRMDPEVSKHFSTLFAGADVAYFTMYGQTEASPRIAYLPPNYAEEKLGAVGIPLAIGQARIADNHETIGELIYSGPNVCMGYARDRADLAKGDELKGELYTGDQARIDEDGFIFVIGRRARYIKLQGQSISLDYVETILQGYKISCRAIGRDNLLVICYADTTPAVIRRILKENFTVHASSVRLQAVESFPMKSSGKPDYADLEARLL